jgi:hypothetical protein
MRIKSLGLSFSLLLLISFSPALLCPLSVAAQGDEKEKAQKEDEKRQELGRKTLGLLDEVATQALSLKLPENRSLVLADAADLLWTHDEKRARSLFWDALNNLASPIGPAEDDSTVKDSTTRDSKAKDSTAKDSTTKRSTTDKTQNLNQYYATFQLRQEFLRKVARRDPQLALDMLRATRLPPPAQPVPANYHLPDESDLEQEIASEAATRDPKRALQIARESLSKGFTFQLLSLLFKLNQQSPEVASEFAGDVIDKLQTANVATDVAAWWMAIDLLRIARTPPDVPAENSATLGSNRLKLSDDQRRELVEIVTNAVLSVSANPNFLSAISAVMPDVEQFAPDRAAKIKTKLADFNRTRTNELRGGKYDDLVSKGTPEELLRAAASADDSQRDALFQAAVSKAVMQGKANDLREFIRSEVEDRSQRNRLNDLLDAQQIGWDVYHGDAESLQKLLPSIRLKEKRAEAMAQMAVLFEKNGKHDEALTLLDEAQALVKVDLQSQTQSDALLTVLLACSLVDPTRAFAAIEPIVDRVNDNLAKLLLLDKLIKSGFVKSDEIILQHPGLISLDFAISKYGQGIVALAKADFNRTKAMADRLQRNELRIMARLLIAQALLHNNEEAVKKQ